MPFTLFNHIFCNFVMMWFCNYFVWPLSAVALSTMTELHKAACIVQMFHGHRLLHLPLRSLPPVLCPPPLPACPLVADSEKFWVRNCNLTDPLATRRRLPNQQQGSQEFVTKRRGRQAGWIGWGHLTRKLPILWPRWQLTDSDSEFLGEQFKTYLVVNHQ